MATTRPRVEVAAPALAAPRFGLFSAATLIDAPGGPWALHGVEYRTAGCVPVQVWGTPCQPDVPPAPPLVHTLTLTVDWNTAPERVAYVRYDPDPAATGADIHKFTAALNGDAEKDIPAFAGGVPHGTNIGSVSDAGPVDMKFTVNDTTSGKTQTYTFTQVPPATPGAPLTHVLKFLVPVTPGPDDPQPITPKTTNDPGSWIDGDPFTLYAAAQCKAPAAPDLEDVARERLSLGEEKAVELYAVAELAARGATPGEATNIIDAVAVLEQSLSDQDADGNGVIWVPRYLAAAMIAAQLLTVEGDHYRTPLGTSVAFVHTKTYPDLDAIPLYATGPVVVRRTPVVVPPVEIDRTTNDLAAVAERTYVVTTDCAFAAVNLKVTA